jgi:hypothetical protein
MKWEGDDSILHGIFVDDFASIPTSEKLKLEFEELHAADFDFTGGKVMDSLLGLEVEQSEDGIKLHLDTCVAELLEVYRETRSTIASSDSEYHSKFLKAKKVPMQPGLVLDKEDCPEAPYPVKQKFYRMMVAKSSVLHCVPGSAARKILRIGWAVALGGVDAPDGVSVISTQPQAQTQSRVHEGAGWIQRL